LLRGVLEPGDCQNESRAGQKWFLSLRCRERASATSPTTGPRLGPPLERFCRAAAMPLPRDWQGTSDERTLQKRILAPQKREPKTGSLAARICERGHNLTKAPCPRYADASGSSCWAKSGPFCCSA